MSKLINQEFIADKARIVEAPRAPTKVDRSFELPTGLYGATVALYLGFLAIMATGFGNPGLIIPMAIFTVFIAGGFGVPMVWTRLAPDTKQKALTWGQFASKGIMTNTGRLSSRDATIQMLILPVLILFWGLAMVTIAAIV
jgi:hypothetical protein